MQIEIVYPNRAKREWHRKDLIQHLRWPFWGTAALCVYINLMVGGVAWSAIVSWSFWVIWSNLISPSLIAMNRISLMIKVTNQICILLSLINFLLAPGFAVIVVPIVCCVGLVISGGLFFMNINKQRLNIIPLLQLDAISIIGAITGLLLLSINKAVVFIVLGMLALIILIACMRATKREFNLTLVKYFSTK